MNDYDQQEDDMSNKPAVINTNLPTIDANNADDVVVQQSTTEQQLF